MVFFEFLKLFFELVEGEFLFFEGLFLMCDCFLLVLDDLGEQGDDFDGGQVFVIWGCDQFWDVFGDEVDLRIFWCCFVLVVDGF